MPCLAILTTRLVDRDTQADTRASAIQCRRSNLLFDDVFVDHWKDAIRLMPGIDIPTSLLRRMDYRGMKRHQIK